MDALEPYLTKVFNGVNGQFTFMDWRRLFRMQELVYKEPCVEFLATIRFRKIKGIHDRKNITFFLGGEHRELSLRDLHGGQIFINHRKCTRTLILNLLLIASIPVNNSMKAISSPPLLMEFTNLVLHKKVIFGHQSIDSYIG